MMNWLKVIGNKIADKITNVSRTSPKNNSETVTNGAEDTGIDREISKERNISPKKRQKINIIN